MKDNNKRSLSIIKILKLLILALILIQTFIVYSGSYSSQMVKDNEHHKQIFNESIDTLKSISRLNAALVICTKQKEHCNHEQTKLFTADLYTNISEFMVLAAGEKELVSTVAMHNFDKVNAYIAQYNETSNASVLQQKLSISLENIVNMIDDILVIYDNNLKVKEEYNLVLLAILSLCILLISIFYYFYSTNYEQQLKQSTKDLTDLFHHVLDNIKDLDLKVIRSRLSSITTSPDEKKIYSMLLFSFEKLEDEKLKTDLYQRLYNLLGYEIRGITNTIQGGVNLLALEKDERELILAKDVITATHTLENLAENFNQLANIDIGKDSNIVNLNKLSNDLIVLLASKSKSNSKSMECYVNNTLPLTFYGNQTGLFWLLLMQMSDAFSTQGYDKVLLTMDCTTTKRVDRLKINLNFYLYSTEYNSLESIKQLPWSKTSKALITNKALARTLISKIKNYQVTRQVIENTSCFSTSFDIQPESYQTETSQLIDKKILVCGASAMQTNVLNKMLSDQGADVIIAHTPNDIFRSISLLDDHDGILLTNKIKGVKVNQLCKIIKARMGNKNIKIFLSVSTSNEVKEVFEHIDAIFYHPCPPFYFVSKMLEYLNKNESEEQTATDELLIVEDDKLQQFILKKILSDFDYACDAMDDGQQVVDNLDNLNQQIIFMDCIMPNLGGIEATKQIRAYEKEHKQLPRIIVGATALTSNEEHKLCIDAGMDCVIHKPYKKDIIYSTLKKYISIGKIK